MGGWDLIYPTLRWKDAKDGAPWHFWAVREGTQGMKSGSFLGGFLGTTDVGPLLQNQGECGSFGSAEMRFDQDDNRVILVMRMVRWAA
jgi:hypothetical protein